MITHQILITFDSARDFRDRQFANYDSTQMHWFLVRDKACWWLTAEAGGLAERISRPKVTGKQVEQFMFSVLKKRGLLDDETLVSFSEVTWGGIWELRIHHGGLPYLLCPEWKGSCSSL